MLFENENEVLLVSLTSTTALIHDMRICSRRRTICRAS
jgi:hypothetical protein